MSVVDKVYVMLSFTSSVSPVLRRGVGSRRICARRVARCCAGVGGKQKEEEEEIRLELVDGYLENAKVRPRIDMDANEYMMLWKLRTMLHADDFKRIFDEKSRRIGEIM